VASNQPKRKKNFDTKPGKSELAYLVIKKIRLIKEKNFEFKPSRTVRRKGPANIFGAKAICLTCVSSASNRGTLVQEMFMTAPDVKHANDVNRTGGHRIAGPAFGKMRKRACQFVTRETLLT